MELEQVWSLRVPEEHENTVRSREAPPKMIKYKFSIGQTVKIEMYNPWIGEYDVSATIISLGNVFLNGVPTYNIRTINQEILTEVSETRLSNE